MKNPELLSPAQWKDYELIDSGDFEKLERFGKWVTVRPEPQAIWGKSLSDSEWESTANAIFRKEGRGDGRGEKRTDTRNDQRGFKSADRSDERGEWSTSPEMPGQWWMSYQYKQMNIKMRLGLTAFKHVGIFPEQAENWNFIYDKCTQIEAAKGSPANILNLFAYTGGATLAARSAGADVTHVDSVKQVVSWSRENMEASGLDGVRWIVDDALKFVQREVRRGKKYDGIILDPPAYGRGPDGEKWVLEQNLRELLEQCALLLPPVNGFLVLNLYSMGLSALLAKVICNQVLVRPAQNPSAKEIGGPTKYQNKENQAAKAKNSSPGNSTRIANSGGDSPNDPANEQFGELYFSDRAGKTLPLGVFYRISF